MVLFPLFFFMSTASLTFLVSVLLPLRLVLELLHILLENTLILALSHKFSYELLKASGRLINLDNSICRSGHQRSSLVTSDTRSDSESIALSSSNSSSTSIKVLGACDHPTVVPVLKGFAFVIV